MVQSWLDNSGLYQVYGVDQTTTGKGGEYSNVGTLREIEVRIPLTALNQNEVILDDNIFMPAGVIIQEVVTVATVAAATGVAIDLGLVRTDRTTEIDFDGLLAAFPIASMDATGEQFTLTKGSTFAGALLGATTANVGHITCSATTATAFTAGVLIVRIRYYRP